MRRGEVVEKRQILAGRKDAKPHLDQDENEAGKVTLYKHSSSQTAALLLYMLGSVNNLLMSSCFQWSFEVK